MTLATARRGSPRGGPDDDQSATARLIGKGLSNHEITDELCISGVTVKSHIGRIFG